DARRTIRIRLSCRTPIGHRAIADLCRFRVVRGDALGDADLVDPASLDVQDFDVEAVDVEPLADGRHASDPREQIAADRLEAFALDFHGKLLRELFDVRLSAHDVAAALVDERLAFDVVLVTNFADDLFEQILDGDEPGRPTVLVDDDRALGLLALELLQ